MLQKIIDCESLKIYQENVYDVDAISKITSLQSSDCNFTIKEHSPQILFRISSKK